MKERRAAQTRTTSAQLFSFVSLVEVEGKRQTQELGAPEPTDGFQKMNEGKKATRCCI